MLNFRSAVLRRWRKQFSPLLKMEPNIATPKVQRSRKMNESLEEAKNYKPQKILDKS